jgi:hypothetical protein
MTPQERDEYERAIADLKSNLDEEQYTSLWSEGRSMTMEQAIQFTLG